LLTHLLGLFGEVNSVLVESSTTYERFLKGKGSIVCRGNALEDCKSLLHYFGANAVACQY
jgi:hypothetical protein